jgi:hypothetical protein
MSPSALDGVRFVILLTSYPTLRAGTAPPVPIRSAARRVSIMTLRDTRDRRHSHRRRGRFAPYTNHRSAFTLERDCIHMTLKERLTNRLGSVWFLTLTAVRR